MSDQRRSRPPYTPVELTEVEKARQQALKSAVFSLGDAFLDGDSDGAQAAISQVAQIGRDRDRDREINSLHLPADAGEHTDGLTRIMLRIPDGWGRWVRLRHGWYPIVTGLNEKLAAIDPDYDVHQVKQKLGRLCYYFATSTSDRDQYTRMEDLVAEAEATAERTCEMCGTMSSDVALRTNDEVHRYRWLMVLCDACEAAHPDHLP